jgi:hypothetical protein
MSKKGSKLRQKVRKLKLERRKRKRARAQSGTPPQPASLRARLRSAGDWPLMECLLTEDWQSPGEIIQILIARRSHQDQIAVGVFLVDLGCLGVKNAFGQVLDSSLQYKNLRGELQEEQPLRPADLNLAAKIIREGIAYAEKLGFKPHPDYRDAALVLGEADPNACEVLVPLGREGKPFVVSGPFDNVHAIMAKLERAVGPGRFHYLVHLEEPPDEIVEAFSQSDARDEY